MSILSFAVRIPTAPEATPQQIFLQDEVLQLTEQLSNCQTDMQTRELGFRRSALQYRHAARDVTKAEVARMPMDTVTQAKYIMNQHYIKLEEI